MRSPLFLPAIALVLWSLVMLFWLAGARLPAMRKAGIVLTNVVGGRGNDLEGVLPDRVNWKSHNYAHLMEQPTLFYATVVILALAGADGALEVLLAWAYVILRVLHSLVQALWNRVVVRFSLFLLSTIALTALAIDAARTVM